MGKARYCTHNKADDPASRVWSQGNVQDPKGEEEKVTLLLSPCLGEVRVNLAMENARRLSMGSGHRDGAVNPNCHTQAAFS